MSVGCPPVIHIGQITAAVDQLLHTERVGCKRAIHIEQITAVVDQLLHTEE